MDQARIWTEFELQVSGHSFTIIIAENICRAKTFVNFAVLLPSVKWNFVRAWISLAQP